MPSSLPRWPTSCGRPGTRPSTSPNSTSAKPGTRSSGDTLSIAQAVIVTKDEDFAARARQSRRSPTVVWLRIGNCSSQALVRWFVPLLPGIVREVVQGHRLIQVR